MALIIKNQDSTTLLDVYIYSGKSIQVAPGGEIDLSKNFTIEEIANSDVPFHIQQGNVILNDGIEDLTISEAVEQLISPTGHEIGMGYYPSRYKLIAGMTVGERKAVYISGTNEVKLAKADSDNTLPCMGFTTNSANQTEIVRVLTNDVLNGFSGLIPGSPYYLSQTTVGEITSTKPTSGIIVRVGQAITSTKLDIHLLRLSGGDEGTFGSEYNYAESEGDSSTNSSTYQEKVSITTGVVPAGDYRIGWSCLAEGTDENLNIQLRVQLDDTTDLWEILYATKKTWTDGVRFPLSGFQHVTLTNASHTIDFDYKNTNNKTTHIQNARLEIWRVS